MNTSRLAQVGGARDSYSQAGAFYIYINNTGSYSDATVGSRIMCL